MFLSSFLKKATSTEEEKSCLTPTNAILFFPILKFSKIIKK